MSEEIIHELLGYKHIQIVQRPDMFNFSLDSILLADFVSVKNSVKKIVDLGCGNAPIPLFLTLKTKALIYGIEIQKDVYDLALKSVKLNKLEDQITIINADLKNIYKTINANSFEIVISNPPYFKYLPGSNINKNDYLTIARHEVLASLEDIIIETKKLLVDKGQFFLIHRTERLSEIIVLLNKYKFSIKKIRFVYPKVEDEEALLVLIESRLNASEGMKVVKPLYVYEGENIYTKEVEKIFNFPKQK
ncbi:MAG: tRNA1(Val) (adenine(37)-N6)-methyltransferase [Bacilli bacterium]|nr:tRNA1(Val) (adenine(37)-N6)-methyltransferase [Bacilli bacterium]